MSKKKLNYGVKETVFDEDKELSWMNYSGLLDMEVEFVSDLGETELTISEILQLNNGL